MSDDKKDANQFSLAKLEFMNASINAEIDAQLTFGARWGELLPDYPKTLDDAIAKKKAELAALEAKAGVKAADVRAESTLAAAFTSPPSSRFTGTVIMRG